MTVEIIRAGGRRQCATRARRVVGDGRGPLTSHVTGKLHSGFNPAATTAGLAIDPAELGAEVRVVRVDEPR